MGRNRSNKMLLAAKLALLSCVVALTLHPVSSTADLAAHAEQLALFAAQALDPALATSLVAQLSQLGNFSEPDPSLFDRRSCEAGTQLPLLGATKPWPDILSSVNDAPDQKLLLLLRHGLAFENLSPNNSVCEFELDGRTVVNWDSGLTTTGREQASNASVFLHSAAPTGESWSSMLGLATAPRYFSPLSRTLQTAHAALGSGPAAAASSLLRASLGNDVCNGQHRVTADAPMLPNPWNTGCKAADQAKPLAELYNRSFVQFHIRPAGAATPGLLSDSDTLWRKGYDEPDEVQTARAKALLMQVFSSSKHKVAVVVTHGEMIEAFGRVVGVDSLSAANAQFVPIVLRYDS